MYRKLFLVSLFAVFLSTANVSYCFTTNRSENNDNQSSESDKKAIIGLITLGIFGFGSVFGAIALFIKLYKQDKQISLLKSDINASQQILKKLEKTTQSLKDQTNSDQYAGIINA